MTSDLRFSVGSFLRLEPTTFHPEFSSSTELIYRKEFTKFKYFIGIFLGVSLRKVDFFTRYLKTNINLKLKFSERDDSGDAVAGNW